MKNLEKLSSNGHFLTLEDLARVFQSCSKLVELDIFVFEFEMDEVDDDLVDQLRPGFQRLRRLDLEYFIDDDTWPGFQQLLT